jgi:hypothetical protein
MLITWEQTQGDSLGGGDLDQLLANTYWGTCCVRHCDCAKYPEIGPPCRSFLVWWEDSHIIVLHNRNYWFQTSEGSLKASRDFISPLILQLSRREIL